MRIFVLTAFVSLVFACGGGAKEVDGEQVVMKSDFERTYEAPPPREATAPPREGKRLEEEPEEEVTIEIFSLAPGESYTSEDSGLVLSWESEKKADYRFKITNPKGDSYPFVLDGAPPYFEGVAFGRLVVVSADGDHGRGQMTPAESSAPANMELALSIAKREIAARPDCQGERVETIGRKNGTLIFRVLDGSGRQTCDVAVGLYTRAVIAP